MAELTEEEQIEALKRWWANYGTSTLVGVALAVAGFFGYQAWQNHQEQRGEAASAIYQQMLDALDVDNPLKEVDKDKISTAKFLAKQLEGDYAGSAYSHLAALFLARIAVEDGDLKTAQTQLQWALSHGIDDSLKVIVTMRLARVQLGLNKQDEALKTLDTVEPDEYRASYDEVKGDIYHAMGDNEKAREAYERAVNALAPGEEMPLLKMKLDNLQPPAAVIPDKSTGKADSGKSAGKKPGAADQKTTDSGAG